MEKGSEPSIFSLIAKKSKKSQNGVGATTKGGKVGRAHLVNSGKGGRPAFHYLHHVSPVSGVAKVKYIKAGPKAAKSVTRAVDYYLNRERGQLEPVRDYRTAEKDKVSQERALSTLLENQSDRVAAWQIMLSPGDNDIDFDRFTRDVMQRFEKNIGFKLNYVYTVHRNTMHHHAHVLGAGRNANGKGFYLSKEQIELFRHLVNEYLFELQHQHLRDHEMSREKQQWREDDLKRSTMALMDRADSRSVNKSSERADTVYAENMGAAEKAWNKQAQDLLKDYYVSSSQFFKDLHERGARVSAERMGQINPAEEARQAEARRTTKEKAEAERSRQEQLLKTNPGLFPGLEWTRAKEDMAAREGAYRQGLSDLAKEQPALFPLVQGSDRQTQSLQKNLVEHLQFMSEVSSGNPGNFGVLDKTDEGHVYRLINNIKAIHELKRVDPKLFPAIGTRISNTEANLARIIIYAEYFTQLQEKNPDLFPSIQIYEQNRDAKLRDPRVPSFESVLNWQVDEKAAMQKPDREQARDEKASLSEKQIADPSWRKEQDSQRCEAAYREALYGLWNENPQFFPSWSVDREIREQQRIVIRGLELVAQSALGRTPERFILSNEKTHTDALMANIRSINDIRAVDPTAFRTIEQAKSLRERAILTIVYAEYFTCMQEKYPDLFPAIQRYEADRERLAAEPANIRMDKLMRDLSRLHTRERRTESLKETRTRNKQVDRFLNSKGGRSDSQNKEIGKLFPSFGSEIDRDILAADNKAEKEAVLISVRETILSERVGDIGFEMPSNQEHSQQSDSMSARDIFKEFFSASQGDERSRETEIERGDPDRERDDDR